MTKKVLSMILSALLLAAIFGGCQKSETNESGPVLITEQAHKVSTDTTSFKLSYSQSDSLNPYKSQTLNNQVVQPVYGKDFALTYISDFCDTIIQFIEKSNNATELFGKHSAPSYGIYNVSNSGTVNNKELLKEIRHLCKKYYKIVCASY